VPLYTTLVAVLQNGEPRIGVIHAPAVGETAYAAIAPPPGRPRLPATGPPSAPPPGPNAENTPVFRPRPRGQFPRQIAAFRRFQT
jgi:hypothetical protein